MKEKQSEKGKETTVPLWQRARVALLREGMRASAGAHRGQRSEAVRLSGHWDDSFPLLVLPAHLVVHQKIRFEDL